MPEFLSKHRRIIVIYFLGSWKCYKIKFSNLSTWGPLVVQAKPWLLLSPTSELPTQTQTDEAREERGLTA